MARPGPQESSVSSGRYSRIMVRMRETIESFNVVGLPLRTSNREAARTIPTHWRAAAAVGLLDALEPDCPAMMSTASTLS